VVKKSVKSQTRLSPAKRAELIADYVAGMPVAAIASKFRVHRATVSELARRAGVPVREASLPAGERAQAASLYEAGMTLAQVAERMTIDVGTVRTAVLAEGGRFDRQTVAHGHTHTA
jgi:DNA-directed RNA polymerase specialized sigma24 family protein